MKGKMKMGKKIMTEEEKQAKKARKAEKKLIKKQKKQERCDLLETIETKFDLIPNVKLSKKEKAVLNAIEYAKGVSFYELCEYMDVKPSKMDKILIKLIAEGLVGCAIDEDEIETYTLTEDGNKYFNANKAAKKSEKRFREFLNCLSNDELKEFIGLAGNLVEDTAEEAVAEQDSNIQNLIKYIPFGMYFFEHIETYLMIISL